MNPFPRWMKATLAIALLVLLAGGGWHYHKQERHLRRHAAMELQSIAHLKVGQIVEWREQRLAHASVLMDRIVLIANVKQWFAAPTEETAREILRQFRSLQKNCQYQDVGLVDLDGQVRLSLSGHTEGTYHGGASEAMAAALRERRPVLTDLHRGKDNPRPHISVVAPLFSANGDASKPLAAIILVSDARQFLYPLIQSWPTPSETAETLLVRRDGEDLLFLNDLRHQADTALKLRIPLSRTDVPAVMAVLGKEGVVQGKDYRGVETLSVLKAIPDSPWFMVAKVDVEEALAGLRHDSILLLGLLLALAALAAAAVLVAWQRNMKAHYRALYQSEAKFSVAFDHSPAFMAITCAADGKYVAVNEAFLRNTGYTRDEVIGHTEEELNVFADCGDHERLASRVPETGFVCGMDVLIRVKSGELRNCLMSNNEIQIGGQTHFLSAIIDITDRKAAEEALRASEARYRLLVENANEAIAVAQDGMLKFVNRMAIDISGYSEQDLTSRPFPEFVHPDDRGMVVEHYLRRLKGDVSEPRYVFRLMVRDGSIKWIEIGAVLIAWEGNPATLNFFSDVTDRKRAEEERERLMAAIEQVGEIIVVTDPEGTIEYVNPALERITGYTKEEAVGQNPRILKSGKQDKAFYQDLWGTIASGRTWKGRMVNKRKDGTLYTEEDTVTPVRDASGRIVHYVAVKRDITEHLRLAAEFLQAQKMESVGRLAGGVAHDFNNKLSIILGYAGLALNQVDPAHPLHADIEEILKAAKHSTDIVQKLLAFARKQIISPRVLDLNGTVEPMLKMLGRLIGEDIDLVWAPGPDLWQVNMDPSQADQFLANLVVNARDAILGAGKVTIETRNAELDEPYCQVHPGCAPGQYALLSIIDDGCGMDKDVLAQIFEPFFTTKEMDKGTGLGLATVYGIVKQNNGYIEVQSEPGKGSSFQIYLPRHEAETETDQEKVLSAGPATGTETVLLVEDQKTVLELGRRLLTELGYTVLTAATTDEAIRLAAEHIGEIHLLMTDVVMPGMNGRDLAERIRQTRPEIKCLYMSGYTADITTRHGVIEEGIHFIQKPFSLHDLATKGRGAFGTRNAELNEE